MMGLSAVHMLIFGIVAILLFGNRLPSVARSLGRTSHAIRTDPCADRKTVKAYETCTRSVRYERRVG